MGHKVKHLEDGSIKFEPDNKTKIIRWIARIIFIVSLAAPIWTVYSGIMFDKYCEGHLKQAADANSIELALEELNIAIEYAENHGLTKGYTSIFIETESDNVGYWYKNLIACRRNLELCKDASQDVKNLQLKKLHESLIDNGENGTKVTVPEGISRFPYNRLCALGNTIVCIEILIL
jgi:hypothetical protein